MLQHDSVVGSLYGVARKGWVLCCRNPVKFWFIKNYMSPQMKRFVPEMAAHYKFHYQFVTYKWPTFLHKQVSSTVGLSMSVTTAILIQALLEPTARKNV